MTLALIIGGGLGTLIGLAVVIGQRSAQEHAWSVVAAERRELNALRTSMSALADDLTAERLQLVEWEHRLVLASEALRRADPEGRPS